MLVLSRRNGESLLIDAGGVEIRVQVQRVGGHSVTIGIEAPRQVRILREELADRRIDVQDAQPTEGHS